MGARRTSFAGRLVGRALTWRHVAMMVALGHVVRTSG